ncbi:hypothetical protein M0638_20430 [Roseomonas sp. NAR14]|uniref:Uncharacterized protein n=1 Tax=Roseomonas acroporae TaxID=2937791 RepID=A0A9X1YBL0_9PROT|nr:hypothetical protein [Roseomonas acroporae]MCK8786742.1 hypothetical protein [Roseomonas acroporae]
MSRPLSPEKRERRVEVLALLASPHDGERAAAGLAATRILASAGLTWEDVIPAVGSTTRPGTRSAPPPPPPYAWEADTRTQRFRAEVNFVLLNLGLLKPAERSAFMMHNINAVVMHNINAVPPAPGAVQAVRYYAELIRGRMP